MEKNYNFIERKKYDELKEKISSSRSFDEIIEIHSYLTDKWYDIIDCYNCGLYALKHFLNNDFGTRSDYQLSPGGKEFVESTYLSDYIKKIIKEYYADAIFSDEVLNVLNGEKNINDMSEEEIKTIYDFMNSDFNNQVTRERKDIYYAFMDLLYKLKSKGPTSFIKNNIDNNIICENIMDKSGLIPEEHYYLGMLSEHYYFNERTLIAIFRKLQVLDINYALNFVELVNKINLYSISEFIAAFKAVAENNFDCNGINLEEVTSEYDYSDCIDDDTKINMDMYIDKMKKSFFTVIKSDIVNYKPEYYDDASKYKMIYR